MASTNSDKSVDRAAGAKKSRRRWLFAGAALGLAGGLLWLSRTTIADNLVADQLEERGVSAKYQIESIGPRTQRIANVVIGDPAKPDLVARWVELDIGWTWSGPTVSAIRADGVRLFGKWDEGRLTFGEVDRLLPPPSDEPISIPDLAVKLSDARARIDTPWGTVGAHLQGSGRLRGGFVGELALVSAKLIGAGCSTDRISAFGKISVENGSPGFTGPLRAAEIQCDAAGLKLKRFDSEVDASLSGDFTKWQGDFDTVSSGIGLVGGKLSTVSVKGKFAGTAESNRIDFEMAGKKLTFADAAAQSFAANGHVALTAGVADGLASVSIAGGQAPQSWRRQLQSLMRSKDAPLADLITALSSAGSQALSNVSGQAKLKLSGAASAPQLQISDIAAQSASGARLSASDESLIRVDLSGSPRWSANGNWSLAGGNLPKAQMRLNRSANGALRAEIRLAPLQGRTSRLTLSPVSITGGPRGALQIITKASFSGDIGGGRLSGLTLPVNAFVTPDGSFRLAGGCSRVTLSAASIAAVELGPNALQLCSALGQPLFGYDCGRLNGAVRLVAPRLNGRTGDSALALSASQGLYTVANGQWMLDNVAVTVGEGEAASNFLALQIDGTAAGGSWSGNIAGASGEIGTIPLDLQEIIGTWRYDKALLTLLGTMAVSDQTIPSRFHLLKSDDVNLQFADGRISATANFKEAKTGTRVGRVDLRHDFADAVGSADLIVESLQFGPTFQPEQLTRLALGVIANADAKVSGRGRIDWRGSQVTSSGRFTADATQFAAAFGSVDGARGTIVFDDLLAMHTLPGQKVRLDEINPGFPVLGGEITYQLLDANRVHIEGGSWPFAGGELRLRETTLDFDVNAVRRLEFELTGVDAAVFLTELGFDNINASGIFDGVLPVEFSGLGGRIVGGRLSARPGGGEVAYVGELTNYNLGTMANFAFNMLKSLRYESMEITLDGDLDGEMLTDMQFKGLRQGAGASRNIITRQIEKLPIVFNVKINAPFRELIGSAKSLYDPTDLLRQRLPGLIEAQQNQRKILVQPIESEKVP